MSCILEPALQSALTLVSRYPFRQLSVDHVMDVHRMSTIKLNTDCICLGHLASNAWSLQGNMPGD